MQERGYNQSLLLAQSLSRLRHIPLWQPLVKQFETTPQKSLPAMERSGNVLGAFDLAVGMKLEGAVLLLVEPIPHIGGPEAELIRRIKELNVPAVLVINKIDTVEKEELLPFAYGAKGIGEIATIPTAPAAQGAYYARDHILRTCLPMQDTFYKKPAKKAAP